MLRLSKKIEYAILAMQYIAANSDKTVSAKEISVHLNISFDFLSKTLQKLMKKEFIISHQGINGGYMLVKKPEDITIAQIIDALDDSSSIVECFADSDNITCERTDSCTIRDPLKKIQKDIDSILRTTTINSFIR